MKVRGACFFMSQPVRQLSACATEYCFTVCDGHLHALVISVTDTVTVVCYDRLKAETLNFGTATEFLAGSVYHYSVSIIALRTKLSIKLLLDLELCPVTVYMGKLFLFEANYNIIR